MRDQLIEAVKNPDLKEVPCNSSSEWIEKHEDKQLKFCEGDKWVISDDPYEPLYKEG